MYIEVINGFCDATEGDVYPGHRFNMEDKRAKEAVRLGRVKPVTVEAEVAPEPPPPQPVSPMPTKRRAAKPGPKQEHHHEA